VKEIELKNIEKANLGCVINKYIKLHHTYIPII